MLEEAHPFRMVDPTNGVTLFSLQVRNPTFDDIDALTAAGWEPNDPGNDLDLQNSTLFITADHDAALALMPKSEWDRTDVSELTAEGEEPA